MEGIANANVLRHKPLGWESRVACEKLGIRVVDTRHEVTAVFAADAVARLTGEGRAERAGG